MRRAKALLDRVRSAVLLAVLACAAVPAAAVELKVATIAPDGSHWMERMRSAADTVAERTSGRVTFKFYPGGVMGNDAQVLRKIRVGQLHGGAFTAGGLASRYGGLNLYGIPLLFRSLDEVDYVRRELDAELLARLEQAGFVGFGFVEGGFANLLSSEPIATVEDLRRKKVWVPDGDEISFLAMQTLGLSPVVLPVTDVLTGLQTGLLDVSFASPVAALVLQWHTRVKFITELPVSYSMGVFALKADAFRRLSSEDQAIVREVITEAVTELDRAARADNARAREVLLSSGVQPVHVNAADVEVWRETIEGLYPQLRSRPDMDGELFDRLLELLRQYRASGASGSH